MINIYTMLLFLSLKIVVTNKENVIQDSEDSYGTDRKWHMTPTHAESI